MTAPDTPGEVRRATAADVPAIASLLDVAAPGSPKAAPEVLRWQYPSLDDARLPGSWIVTVGGEVVAHSGGIAVRVVHDGSVGVGVFGADAATHPAHRRRGHFRAAAAARVEEAGRLGALVSWSVPNASSTPGLCAAGLRPVARGRLRWLPVVGRRLLRRRTGPAAPARHATLVDDPLEAVATLCRAPTAGVLRDEAWWRWRYLERPGGRYLHAVVAGADRAVGVATATVLRRRGLPVAAVCDWHADDVAALELLLTTVAAHLDVVAVSAATRPGTPADRALDVLGARTLPRPLEPQPLAVLADRELGAWELSWGELDWV